MANKFKKQWILEDELYLSDRENEGVYAPDIVNSTYFKSLLEYGGYMLKFNEQMSLMGKIFPLQDIYYYMYTKNYLTDKRYVIDSTYHVDSCTYSFKLDLTKLLNDVELEKDIREYFSEYDDEYENEDANDLYISYINSYAKLICHPKAQYCCKYCGTMCLCASRFDMKYPNKKYACEKCNSLSSDNRAIVNKAYKDAGLINAISKRNSLVDR